MAATMEFKTAKRRAKSITFKIDDDEYTFTPPKMAPALLGMLEGETEMKATFDWIGQGLAEGEEERLIGRLKDPKDDFDLDNLETITRWLMEQVTGRPTT